MVRKTISDQIVKQNKYFQLVYVFLAWRKYLVFKPKINKKGFVALVSRDFFLKFSS